MQVGFDDRAEQSPGGGGAEGGQCQEGDDQQHQGYVPRNGGQEARKQGEGVYEHFGVGYLEGEPVNVSHWFYLARFESVTGLQDGKRQVEDIGCADITEHRFQGGKEAQERGGNQAAQGNHKEETAHQPEQEFERLFISVQDAHRSAGDIGRAGCEGGDQNEGDEGE